MILVRFRIFILTFFIANTAISQDMHLSQYYTNNQTLSPALVGYFEGDIRVTANYRNQWRQISATPIATNMLSFEKKIKHYYSEYGAGVVVIDDRVNAFGLTTNKVLLTASAQQKFHKNIFRLGIQGGVVMRSTDFGGQSFPGQWNYSLGEFDTESSTGESINANGTYADINAGLSWSRNFKKFKALVSYGINHLNSPKESFFNSKKLPLRQVFHTRFDIPLIPKLSLHPHVLYMTTTKATDLVMGTNFKRKITDDFTAMFGVLYRGVIKYSDAVIGLVGFSYKRFELGLSSDFNMSELNKAGRKKKSFEVALIYTTPSVSSKKLTIPCDRY